MGSTRAFLISSRDRSKVMYKRTRISCALRFDSFELIGQDTHVKDEHHILKK